MSDRIDIDAFNRIDMRCGVIVRVEEFPKAKKPAFKLWIDFGVIGVKTSSAQISGRYRRDDLMGRTVIAVVNFPPRQVADFVSEVLVLGIPDANHDVILLKASGAVIPGGRVS